MHSWLWKKEGKNLPKELWLRIRKFQLELMDSVKHCIWKTNMMMISWGMNHGRMLTWWTLDVKGHVIGTAPQVLIAEYLRDPAKPFLASKIFPTSPIKLKLGLQIGGRLLMVPHLDQSNYLANQKQVWGSTVDLVRSLDK